MKKDHGRNGSADSKILRVLGALAFLGACSGAPAGVPAASPSSAPALAPSGAHASSGPVPISPAARAIIDAPDRSDDDRKLDAGRHAAELLSFLHLAPGMKVAEISAGGGYTTELLARAVAPGGVVYGQNSKAILERFAEKPWTERLTKPAMKNVVRVDRDFEDPLPPEARDLDAVLLVLFYHDLFWLEVDRDRMNRAIWNALKPGGIYVVIDHSGRPQTGATEVKTLHRIEENVVKSEIAKAGFQLAQEGSFLRNPQDTRDWNDSPRAAGEKRGTSDRFVLVYKKSP